MRIYRVIVVISLCGLITGCETLTGGSGIISYKVDQPKDIILAEARNSKPVKWKLALGRTLIDRMIPVSSDTMIIGLRSAEPALQDMGYRIIDTRQGKLLWSYPVPAAQAAIAFVSQQLIVVREDNGLRTVYNAFQSRSGKRLWTYESAKSSQVISLLGVKSLLVMAGNSNGGSLQALDMMSGKPLWRHQYRTGNHASNGLVRHIEELDRIYLFGEQAELLSAKDGKLIWSNQAINADTHLQPKLYKKAVYLLNQQNILYKINAGNGKIDWQQKFSASLNVTHLATTPHFLYMRGKDNNKTTSEDRFFIAAINPASGGQTWRYYSAEPMVSNILEYNGRVYAATSRDLICLSQKNGGRYYSKTVTDTESLFPVTLNQYGNKVVFIGELNIVAFSADKGNRLYSHGFTPVTSEADLSALDASITRLRKTIQQDAAYNPGIQSYSDVFLQQSQHYQNMSDNYHRLANIKYSDYLHGNASIFDVKGLRIKADLESTMSSFSANMANLSSIIENFQRIEEMYRQMWAQTRRETFEKRKVLRESIVNAYPAMQSRNYVYRPHEDYHSTEKQFIGVSVIHLPTGKIRHTNISVPYRDYGIWCHVDFEKGIAYQQGLGLNPNDFRYSIEGNIQAAPSYLIAQPITIPK